MTIVGDTQAISTDGAGTRWRDLAAGLVPLLSERADAADATGEFVAAQMELLRERQLMSMLVPTELGGGGATHADACMLLRELAHGCPATSLTFAMHTHLVAAQVWRHHHDLPAPVLPKVAASQLLLVSTGAKDWIDSSGSAVAVDGGFRVSGSKSPSSGAPAGDVLITSIRWEPAPGPDSHGRPSPEGPQVLHLSVPFSAEGVRIEPTWDSIGMRATGSDTVVLDDVFVPDAAVSLVRPAGVWHPVWNVVLGAAMPLIMSTYVGVAEEAVRRAMALTRPGDERPASATAVARMLRSLRVAAGLGRRDGRRVGRPALRQRPEHRDVDAGAQGHRGRRVRRDGAARTRGQRRGVREHQRPGATVPRRARLGVPPAAGGRPGAVLRTGGPRPRADVSSLPPGRGRGPGAQPIGPGAGSLTTPGQV